MRTNNAPLEKNEKDCSSYHKNIEKQYEQHYGTKGNKEIPENRVEKENDFYVLEFKPVGHNNLWAYCTVGMSNQHSDDTNSVELVLYSSREDKSMIDMLKKHANYYKKI